MSVISAIRDFIAAECPYLDEFSEVFSGVSKVEVDTLDENPKNYMIEVAPADPVVRTYTNGDTVRRVAFHFCSRVFFGAADNIDTSDFYEHFSEWLEECTRTGKFPVLGTSREPRYIRATTNGYMTDNETQIARYAIQCEFIYLQKRR